MILFSAYADALKSFLNRKSKENVVAKFRIYKRLGFRLDAYVFVAGSETEDDLKSAFLNSDDFKSVGAKEGQEIDLNFYVYPESRLDSPYFRAVKEGGNDIDPGPSFRFDSFLKQDSGQYEPEKDEPSVVTFYSYKGGMGRTTTMMAYALHLAENKGKKVVVIDCDLEAPGYLNFFGLDKNPELLDTRKNGFVEFICDASFSTEIDVHNYVISVNIPHSPGDKERGHIWVIPAGNLNETTFLSGTRDDHRKAYLEGLAKINLADSQKVVSSFKFLFQKLRESGQINPDVILIDSRTGFNDIFGNAVCNLSRCVVGFFGRSRQTEPGFMNLLKIHKDSDERFNLHIAYSIWPKGDYDKPTNMKAYMTHLYGPVANVSETIIHRNETLEYVGTGDEEIDSDFKKRIRELDSDDTFADYRELFSWIDDDLFVKSEQEKDLKKPSREEVLANLELFAEQLLSKEFDPGKISFVYRECMKFLDDKTKYLFYGKRGCGKTSFYYSLANGKYKGKNGYSFVKVPIIDFDKLMFTPEGDLHWSKYEQSFDFWQIVIWESLLSDGEGAPDSLSEIREKIKSSSGLWNTVQEYKKEEDSLFYKTLDEEEKRLIEQDLLSFDKELGTRKVVVLFDGLDSISDLQKRKTIVYSLVKFWQINSGAFDQILPKIFLDDDFEHSIGEDFEKKLDLKKVGVDMNWSINELLNTMYASVAEDSLKKLTKKKQRASIKNYLERLSPPDLDSKDEKLDTRSEILEELFFGNKIIFDEKAIGKPRDYFERLFSGGNGKYVLLYPFALMLKNAVAKSKMEMGRSIISSEIYATKELVKDVSAQYFDFLRASFKKIVDASFKKKVDLKLLQNILKQQNILDQQNGKFAFRMLAEDTFNELIRELSRRSGIEEDVWNSFLVQSGIVDKVVYGGIVLNRPGVQYCFAPIFWDMWGLKKV